MPPSYLQLTKFTYYGKKTVLEAEREGGREGGRESSSIGGQEEV